ncbi:tetratricopeptide repeat protein [Burkholderia glumae]
MSVPPADPDPAQLHFDRARLLVRADRYAEAELEYRRVLDLLPNAAAAHSNLGNVLEVLGRLPEAETHVRLAAMLDPGLPEAHYNLGSITRQSGRLDEAEAAYRRALALRPDYPDAQFGLATLLLAATRKAGGATNRATRTRASCLPRRRGGWPARAGWASRSRGAPCWCGRRTASAT